MSCCCRGCGHALTKSNIKYVNVKIIPANFRSGWEIAQSRVIRRVYSVVRDACWVLMERMLGFGG